MPPLVTAGTPLGRVSAEAGLPRLTGAVLTVAGHDHQAAVIGAGADGPGDEFDSCGTAEALVRTIAPGLSPIVVAELAEAGITTGWHAVADHWCLLGATQGGLALQRILALLGKDRADLPALDAEAIALPMPEMRVVAPAFGSLDILGIADGDGPAHLWRAALEAVTDQAAEIHDAMSAVSGSTPDVGGHRRLVTQRRVSSPSSAVASANWCGRCQRGRSPRRDAGCRALRSAARGCCAVADAGPRVGAA